MLFSEEKTGGRSDRTHLCDYESRNRGTIAMLSLLSDEGAVEKRSETALAEEEGHGVSSIS